MSRAAICMTDLCREIADAEGRPYAQVHAIVKSFVGKIIVHVAARQGVTVTRLGTFSIRKLGRRRGRDPRTGKDIIHPPSVLPRFRPSDTFKEIVRGE